jgi:hypothetical protein
MEFFSTTSIANELDIPANELFYKLRSLGLIDRKNDKWTLTDLGEQRGGQTRHNPKYGEYIVWPENISFDINHQQKDKPQFLNATTIGKHFNVSSQRLNLILSELGWIEKDLAAGWQITKLGKSIGGRQFEHETSGANYVLWPEGALQHKSLLEVFKENSTEQPQTQKAMETANPQGERQIANINKDNFREKFEAKHRAIDGHYVRSKAEMLIDNWLYQYGLIHAYERKLPIDEDVYCDFYIPSGNGRPQAVYIEFWGLENDPKYKERKSKKIEIYKREGFALIELTDADLQNIDDILAKKLRQFKVLIG